MKAAFLALLLIPAFVGAENCSNLDDATQTELTACYCGSSCQADDEMNQLYQKVLKAYKDDTLFIANFKKAQRQWIVLRDADLEALYPVQPGGNPNLEWGSANPMCRCIVIVEVTKKRVEWLRQWTIPNNETDVCAGSRH